jgi:hypothetical protein
MPLRVTDLITDRRTIQVLFGEEILSITYRPSGFTPATEEKLDDLVQGKRIGKPLVDFLLDTLVAWDLLDDQGNVLPISRQVLAKLPLAFLARLFRAITEDLRPNPPTAGESGGI